MGPVKMTSQNWEWVEKGSRKWDEVVGRGPVNQIRLTPLYLFAGRGRRQDETVVHPAAVPRPGHGGVAEEA